jgi:hypothetical protein
MANWARLTQKSYELDSLEFSHCRATMGIIEFIDKAPLIRRILKHQKA